MTKSHFNFYMAKKLRERKETKTTKLNEKLIKTLKKENLFSCAQDDNYVNIWVKRCLKRNIVWNKNEKLLLCKRRLSFITLTFQLMLLISECCSFVKRVYLSRLRWSEKKTHIVSWKDEWKIFYFQFHLYIFLLQPVPYRTSYNYNYGSKKGRQSKFSARAFDEWHQYTDDNNKSPPNQIRCVVWVMKCHSIELRAIERERERYRLYW